jgi:O-antigen/teichoic acid export membrane protein
VRVQQVQQVPPARAAVGAEPRRLYVEVGAALVALAFLGLLQNIDVLVQGKLAPDESGAYAAVSVASKVLVFGAVVLAGFLLPEAADRRHLGQHALHQLGATLAILAVPAMCLLAIAAAAPEVLLSVAFGPRFTGASGALLPLAAAMTCLGATVLFTHYLLALGQRSVLVALGAATAFAIPLVVWADGDPVDTARADLAFQAALALVTGLMVLIAARRTAKA